MNPAESESTLHSALAGWRVTPRRNPNFRADVWARIERERRAPTWTGYVRAHGALIAAALVMAVVVGAWSGREQAKAREARAQAALVADYVHGLDARWMRLP